MNEKIVEQEIHDEGITLTELFDTLKHNILLLLLITLGVTILGFVYTWFVVTPMYTSSIDIQISSVNENVTTVNQIKNNVKEIAKYKEIIEEVIKNEGIPYTNIEATANSIRSRVTTSDIGNASAVRISYEDSDPVRSTKIVIAIANETARRVNIPKGEEGSLAYSSEKLETINMPRENPTKAPSSPNKTLNLAISVVLGGIIAVVFVILKEQFSSYFKTKKEVEKLTKYSVIALIPGHKGVKCGE